MTPVRSFNEVHSYDFKNQLATSLKNEIENKGKEYILGVDEDEFKKYLVETYTMEPLVIDFENEHISKPVVRKEATNNYHSYSGQIQADVYIFTVSYPFTGSWSIFRLRPSSFILTSADIVVDTNTKMVSFSFKVYNQDVNEFKRAKDSEQGNAFANLQNANDEVSLWNNSLAGMVNSYFHSIKTKYEKENNFFAAINVTVNKNTASVFTAPTVKKRIIPQPIIPKNKEFASEPTMGKESYDDILRAIYDFGKNMEKKPSTYQNKDEEGLRDQFLLVLETRYEGTTATGETFNRGGKTDIILKYAKDGSNLFVAECKFWHGASEFLKAISQLFDRYLTWRDSKTALLLFITNKEFSNVLTTIKNDIKSHPYFVKENGTRGESSFNYIFRLPQDKDKQVMFEVVAFHFDK